MLLVLRDGARRRVRHRNLAVEARAASNQFRSTQSFEAAQAGLEWTLARLNETRRSTTTAGPAAIRPRRRFASATLRADAANGFRRCHLGRRRQRDTAAGGLRAGDARPDLQLPDARRRRRPEGRRPCPSSPSGSSRRPSARPLPPRRQRLHGRSPPCAATTNAGHEGGGAVSRPRSALLARAAPRAGGGTDGRQRHSTRARARSAPTTRPRHGGVAHPRRRQCRRRLPAPRCSRRLRPSIPPSFSPDAELAALAPTVFATPVRHGPGLPGPRSRRRPARLRRRVRRPRSPPPSAGRTLIAATKAIDPRWPARRSAVRACRSSSPSTRGPRRRRRRSRCTAWCTRARSNGATPRRRRALVRGAVLSRATAQGDAAADSSTTPRRLPGCMSRHRQLRPRQRRLEGLLTMNIPPSRSSIRPNASAARPCSSRCPRFFVLAAAPRPSRRCR